MSDPKDQCGGVPLTTEMDGAVPCGLEATGTDSDGEACWSSKLFFFFKLFRGTENKDETTKGTVSAPTLLSLKWHQNHMDRALM